MWLRKKKILSPAIEKFEKNIKNRGLLLVNARYFCSNIYIDNTEEFLKFAKRSKVGTIFTERDYDFNQYFYITNGIVVRTSIERMVRA